MSDGDPASSASRKAPGARLGPRVVGWAALSAAEEGDRLPDRRPLG